MPPISKDCTNKLHEGSFIFAAPCEWENLAIWMLTENNNVHIIVIYVGITVNYCKCILLYSLLNSYLYVLQHYNHADDTGSK